MALRDYLSEEVALDHAEGLLTRREAMRRLGLLGLSGAAAGALLAACSSDSNTADGTDAVADTAAPTSPPTSSPTAAPATTPATTAADPAATPTTGPQTPAPQTPAPAGEGEEIRFSGPNGELIGVLARAETPNGAVLIIHENRGLTPHIRSLPPRLAADGYTALAIDLLSEEGGTASLPSEGDATAALGAAPLERMIADLRAGLDELERQEPDVGLAAIGFCFGGAMTWNLLAAGDARLAAAVPFYGPAPTDPHFTGSPNAAVLGVYAGLDNRVNASRNTAEQALQAAGLTHELRTFDNVDHAFFNDTGPRYNAAAAAEAYAAMLDWFGQHLG